MTSSENRARPCSPSRPISTVRESQLHKPHILSPHLLLKTYWMRKPEVNFSKWVLRSRRGERMWGVCNWDSSKDALEFNSDLWPDLNFKSQSMSCQRPLLSRAVWMREPSNAQSNMVLTSNILAGHVPLCVIYDSEQRLLSVSSMSTPAIKMLHTACLLSAVRVSGGPFMVMC